MEFPNQGTFAVNELEAVPHYGLRAGPFVGGELRVIRFRGSERLSEPFAYDVLFAAAVEPEEAEFAVHGMPASLALLNSHEMPRRIQGIVTAFAHVGARESDYGHSVYRYRVRISPRLWLLSKRRNHRVFQDETPLSIVKAVLGDIGIYPDVRVAGGGQRQLPIPFVYQRGETDLAFLHRVLAQAGMFYYFRHPSGTLGDLAERPSGQGGASVREGMSAIREGLSGLASLGDLPPLPGIATMMVIADDAAATDALGLSLAAGRMTVDVAGVELGATIGATLEGDANTLPYAQGGLPGATTETVSRFELRRELAAKRIHVRDWDIDQSARVDETRSSTAVAANVNLGAAGTGIAGASARGSVAGRADAPLIPPDDLAVVEYQRDGSMLSAGEWGSRDAATRRSLEQLRGKTAVARGASDSRRLAPGYRFRLAGHPTNPVNDEYLVTGVRSSGANPEEARGKNVVIYENTFECTPTWLQPRPPKPDPSPDLGPEPAEVVGPAPGTVYSDDRGRILVRFHWATSNAVSGGAGECWVRCLEPWAGPGYGTMTTPRVGSEVLVEFPRQVGGEPIAIGQLYSRRHARPFPLADDPHVVGIRTQIATKPETFHELTFNDAPGREGAAFRVEGDLNQHVAKDTRATHRGDYQHAVGGARSESTTGNASLLYGRARRVRVGGDSQTDVQGTRAVAVRRNDEHVVQGNASTKIGGTFVATYDGRHTSAYLNDMIARHSAHRVAVIEGSDTLHAKGTVRQSTESEFQMESTLGFSFVCGKSRLTIGPSGITMTTPAFAVAGTTATILSSDTATVTAKTAILSGSDSATVAGANKATVSGPSASAVFDSKATIAGQVSLGGSSSASNSQATQSQTKTPTSVKVVDQDGKPCPNLSVLVRVGGEGGPSRVVVLGADGAASIEGKGPFEAVVIGHGEAVTA